MTIITIDGNIGAGKTTILNYLHTNYNIYIDLEPVDKWKPFLDDIYNNKKNYFNFQIRVWLDRSWIQEKDNTTIIMERSPYFIRNTFNKYMATNNLINKQENNIIQELYNKTDLIWKSDFYIYIRSTPENCLERIYKRGRENEKEITLEYLKAIHKLHEEAYEDAIENKMKVIIIDIDGKTLEDIADEIINFMQNI